MNKKNQLIGLIAFIALLTSFVFTSCDDATKIINELNGTKFTITYENEKGDAPASIQKTENSEFGELDLPVLADVDGFTFDGWKIKNTTTKVNVGDKVTSNLTLVAVWKAKTQGDEPNPPAVEYNKVTDNGNSYIIENPLFTCEQNPEKKLTTNEIIYNRDNNENGYFIKIDKLSDYQVLELTYKGGLLKTDEENVIAVMFDKYLTYNHRMGGDRKNVTAASQTIQIDIPQGIGIDVFIIQQKCNTNNPDWGDTDLTIPLGWEKDFSFFVEKIELKKDSTKIPYKVTETSDSYIIEKPQLVNLWHTSHPPAPR